MERTVHETQSTEPSPRFFVGISIVLALLALLLNPWLVARLFTPGTPLGPFYGALVLALEGGLMAGTVLLFLRRNTMRRKRFLFGMVLALTLLVTAELGLQGVHRVLGPARVGGVLERFPYLPQVHGEGWAKTWAREYEETGYEYEPFLGWSSPAYSGETIHIDNDGTRRTWNPPGSGDAQDTLFVFGGSTTWGYGARDEFTLPSQLSHALAEGGHPFHVENRGEPAYTFTQEVVKLTLLLRAGHRPRLVVFYDGANDVFTAHVYGEPTGMLLESELRDRLRYTGLLPCLGTSIAKAASHSMIWRAIAKTRRTVMESGGETPDEESLRAVAEAVVRYYGATADLLRRLSAAYGFDYVCFWQPVSFTESALLKEEEASDPRIHSATLGALHRYVKEALDRSPPPNFHDISDALENRQAPYYIDYCHVTEEGNRVLADRIYAVLDREYLGGR